MAVETSLPAVKKLVIRYKGIFDFDGLYNVMVHWLKSRRYWFHEHKYKHKVPSPYGAEEEIGWRAERNVTDFVKFVLTVDMHLWDMTEVEVVQKGVKKKLTNARIEITFGGTVEVDYEKRWASNNFFIMLRDFYLKYIVKKEIETIYADQLYYRVNRLHNVVKEFLDMQAKGYEYEGYLEDKG